MPELTLDEHHIYRLDGVEMAGVTTVIKEAGMMGWLPSDEYYRQRGQYVHEAIKLYFKGTLDIDALSDGVKPFVDSAIEYIQVTGYKPTHTELLLYDTLYRFAGTPDAVPLMDWKCGGVESWHVIQLAAYQYLCNVNGIQVNSPLGIHLCNDGKLPKVEPYATHELRNALKIFLSALAVYQWRKNNGLIKGDA